MVQRCKIDWFVWGFAGLAVAAVIATAAWAMSVL